MKKLVLLLTAALVLIQLVVAAPSQAATPFKSPLPPATSVTYSENFPSEIGVYIDCALGGQGELVTLTGNLHAVWHVTLDPNGGYHLDYSYQPQGMSGVGETSGDKYQATGITRGSANFNGLPYTSTDVNNFRIIGQGSGNNFLAHWLVHMTYNGNGELTAYVDNVSVDCK